MYRIKHCSTLFAFVALVWLAGTTFEALGQTPNVRAWGGNSQGELGNGVDSLTASRAIPGQVSGLNGVVAVMGGQSYSLALKGNGPGGTMHTANLAMGAIRTVPCPRS